MHEECMCIDWSDECRINIQHNDFLTINVSGMKYETLKSTLGKCSQFYRFSLQRYR